MPELELKQLQYEADTWKRLLGFMSDENIHQKNRLSEILRNQFDHDLLEELEIYQEKFVKADEKISLLRQETNELDKSLVPEIFEDGHIVSKLITQFKRFRRNLKNSEEQFKKLNKEFTHYLTENILQSH